MGALELEKSRTAHASIKEMLSPSLPAPWKRCQRSWDKTQVLTDAFNTLEGKYPPTCVKLAHSSNGNPHFQVCR